jgi:hypothetical protein
MKTMMMMMMMMMMNWVNTYFNTYDVFQSDSRRKLEALILILYVYAERPRINRKM